MNQQLLRLACALCISIISVFSIFYHVALADETEKTTNLANQKELESGQRLYDQASQLIQQKHISKGVDLLHKAAKYHHIKAIMELASFYELGLGVIQSDKKAIEYYEQAIDLGSLDARFNLALLLAKPVDKFIQLAKARSLMQSLAEKADTGAQYSLSLMYRESLPEAPADAKQSLLLVRMGNELGS